MSERSGDSAIDSRSASPCGSDGERKENPVRTGGMADRYGWQEVELCNPADILGEPFGSVNVVERVVRHDVGRTTDLRDIDLSSQAPEIRSTLLRFIAREQAKNWRVFGKERKHGFRHGRRGSDQQETRRDEERDDKAHQSIDFSFRSSHPDHITTLLGTRGIADRHVHARLRTRSQNTRRAPQLAPKRDYLRSILRFDKFTRHEEDRGTAS
jgi:hypothetical protein